MQTGLALALQRMIDPHVAPPETREVVPDIPSAIHLRVQKAQDTPSMTITTTAGGGAEMDITFTYAGTWWGNETCGYVELEVTGSGAEISLIELSYNRNAPFRAYLTLDAGTPPLRLTQGATDTRSEKVFAEMRGDSVLLPTAPGPLGPVLPPGLVRIGLMGRNPNLATVVLRIRTL